MTRLSKRLLVISSVCVASVTLAMYCQSRPVVRPPLGVLSGTFKCGAVRVCKWGPTGRYLAVGGDGGVMLWDTSECRQKWVSRCDPWVVSIAFSEEAQCMVVGTASAAVILLDAQTGTELNRWSTVADLRGVPHCVTLSADGTLAAVDDPDHGLRVWDTRTRMLVMSLAEVDGDGILSAVFSPSGTLLASGTANGCVRVWDTRSGSTVFSSSDGHGGSPVTALAISGDDQYLATCTNIARVWNLNTGEMMATIEAKGGTIWSAAFAGDGSRTYPKTGHL